MKRTLARLLLNQLARLGLVFFAADPAQGDPSATPTNSADDAADPEGGDEQHENDPAKPAKDGDAAHDDRDKAIRKLQRRVDNRTRALGERDATIAQLRQELETRRSANDDDGEDEDDGKPAKGRREPTVDVEQRAREIARETLQREHIAKQTKAMLDRGKAIEGFRELALDVAEDLPFVDRAGKPTPFIEAVLDTDNPEGLLAHLGRNPDLRDELSDLSPAQLARRFAKLEIELAKKPEKRSNAAKPLEPVSGRGSDTSRDEAAMSDAEWAAQRRKRA